MAVKAQLKRLAARIEVMEMKGLYATVIAAQRASPTSLFDKDSLDAPPPLRNGFDTTPRAAIVATALKRKLNSTVALAQLLNPDEMSSLS
jgi:hypothetical protein